MMRVGTGLLLEEVGVLVGIIGITIREKSPAEAPVAMAAGQTAWVRQRGLFSKYKSCQMVKKNLKTVKSEEKTEVKRPLPPKNISLVPLQVFHCKWIAPSTPVRRCFDRISYSGSLLHILIKLDFSAGQGARARCHFPCRKIAVSWQCCFAIVFATAKFSGLQYLGLIEVDRQHYSSPINGLFEANRLQAAEISQCCGKTAMLGEGCCWWRRQ